MSGTLGATGCAGGVSSGAGGFEATGGTTPRTVVSSARSSAFGTPNWLAPANVTTSSWSTPSPLTPNPPISVPNVPVASSR